VEKRLLLLGLLKHQEMHGYQINDFIERQMGFCTNIKKPTAYYVLDRLAQEGYVTQTEQREGNRPPRKVYRITPEGETYLQTLLRQNLSEVNWPTFAVDVGLAFLEALPAEEVRRLLSERLEKVEEYLAHVNDLKQPHSPSLQTVIGHHIALLKAERDWLANYLTPSQEKQDQ